MGFCSDPSVSNYWINGFAVRPFRRYRGNHWWLHGAPIQFLLELTIHCSHSTMWL